MALLSLIPLAACGKGDDTGDSKGNDGGNAPDVVINEILAENTLTNMDELGEYDDWIELYNPGENPVDLAGTYLSDIETQPTLWPFPDGASVPAHGFLLVWCDDATGSDGLHASFKLDKAGDQVLISYVHGAADPVRIDWVQFGTQQPDLSAARVPDGATGDTAWNPAATPTPGTSNGS